MTRVPDRPEMLRSARERAGPGAARLRQRFPRLNQWERGEASPTLKQLEDFAKATFVPIGFLFDQEMLSDWR